jgi:hypothetical protein
MMMMMYKNHFILIILDNTLVSNVVLLGFKRFLKKERNKNNF